MKVCIVKPSTRNKHIKIANRSDLSWATVNHYMADPLADSPEDDKEIDKSLTTRYVMTWNKPRRRTRRVEVDKEGAVHPDSGYMLTLLQIWSMREVLPASSNGSPVGFKCWSHVGIVVCMAIHT